MSNNQIEVVFKEEIRGRNALHFWVGLGSVLLAVYLWWNGWFSQCCIEFNAAPEALENSYYARTNGGYASTGDGGYGSTGAVSILFDTFCLIGWGVTVGLVLMRKFLAGVLERLGFVTNGVYRWANQQQPAPTQAAQPDAVKHLENKVAKVTRNHEQRLRVVEGKTQDIPEPEPPPPPKTAEEILQEQAEVIEQLKAELEESKKPKPTTRRRSTKKTET